MPIGNGRLTLIGGSIFYSKKEVYDMAKAKANKKIERFGKVNIGVWVGKETYENLVEIAEQEELTLSDVTRIALKEYVAKKKK